MNTYLISYDLIRPHKDYPNLITHLKSYSSWARPLESVWLIKSALTAAQVRNAAQTHTGQRLTARLGEGQLQVRVEDNHLTPVTLSLLD